MLVEHRSHRAGPEQSELRVGGADASASPHACANPTCCHEFLEYTGNRNMWKHPRKLRVGSLRNWVSSSNCRMVMTGREAGSRCGLRSGNAQKTERRPCPEQQGKATPALALALAPDPIAGHVSQSHLAACFHAPGDRCARSNRPSHSGAGVLLMSLIYARCPSRLEQIWGPQVRRPERGRAAAGKGGSTDHSKKGWGPMVPTQRAGR